MSTEPGATTRTQLKQLIASTEFMIIGHRGAAGLAPENTLQSFRCALDWHCPMLELDVYACVDQHEQTNLLVIHDDTLNRTTNGRGRVMDHSIEQLRRLDAGGGQQIPLLREVVELIRRHDLEHRATTVLNIELKGPATAAPTAAALAGMQGLPLLISSFDHGLLEQFHQLAPACPVAPLYDRFRPDWQATAERLQAVAVNLSVRAANSSRVASIRKAGYAVFVYTVNTIAEARRLRSAGVNGVFTDRPDLLMPMVEAP
jgi:glycerophosphoryl diester phosphodiesterase